MKRSRRRRSTQPRVLKVGNHAVPRVIVIGLLVLVLAIMLFAGLQPYASYTGNWVAYDSSAGSTRFGGYGLATGKLGPGPVAASMEGDLRIQLTPTLQRPEDESFHILAQLGSYGSDDPIIIGQWNTSLIVVNSRDFRNEFDLPRASANLEAFIGRPVDIDITFSTEETRIDADGKFAADGKPFSFSEPVTRISIGNAPVGTNGWIGRLSRFAVLADSDPGSADVYAFDQNNLPTIKNLSPGGQALAVPLPGHFPDRSGINMMSLKQLFDQNLKDVAINFLGFAPFGFMVAALLNARRRPRGMLFCLSAAVLAGFAVSLGIEMSQTMIPGRSPHLHDLVLNTAGALPGALAFFGLMWAAPRLLSRAAPAADPHAVAPTDVKP